MKRRDVLKAGGASAALMALPSFGVGHAFGADSQTLRFVPDGDLSGLDPVWTTAVVVGTYAEAVYDTLYGLDKNYNVHPQMVEGHVVEDDGLTWKITLRDGLMFHDNEPVLARDCVASIKRFVQRDTLGQSLGEVTEELTALDDKTLQFRLKKPFALLPNALAHPVTNMACIMPERMALTPPDTQITDSIGSGPFRFLADEWDSGSRAVFERFDGYVPRQDDFAPSYTAGPKIAHVDRVIWQTISDPATAVAALQAGEVDAVENVVTDFLPILKTDPSINLVRRAIPTLPIMRFNHLTPPFNNPRIRRAILHVVDQRQYMMAIMGAENEAFWETGVGVFTPGAPMASDAGMDVLTGPRDFDYARREIQEAGYDGSPVVLMDPADSPWNHAAALLTADVLKRSGLNVDVQTMDWGTLVQRRPNQEPADKGGWNVFITGLPGNDCFNPAAHLGLKANGKDGWFGWPTSERILQLRSDWFDAPDLEAQNRIGRELQEEVWNVVTYIPLGAFSNVSGYRSKWTDIQPQMSLFFTVRPTE